MKAYSSVPSFYRFFFSFSPPVSSGSNDAAATGIRLRRRQNYRSSATFISSADSPTAPYTLFPKRWLDVLTGLTGRLKAASNELDAFLESVIEMQIKSSENNQKDMVQSLLHLIQTDQYARLTRNNIKAILLVSPFLPSNSNAKNYPH
ncbi:hypothetical protein V6N13_046688 [Hibiscus sabdariffa]